MSNKKIKNIIKKQKTICIIGASRKLGVTHISLCLANFLGSALKQKVLYIELAKESQLLGVVGENQIKLFNRDVFSYKGVLYALACDTDAAMSLINNFHGFVIVDISKYSDETKVIFNRCEKRIVIGSMKPWCMRDYICLVELFIEWKGWHGMKNSYYNLSDNKNEKNAFKKIFNQPLNTLPYIDNPYSLKEENFDSLISMLE